MLIELMWRGHSHWTMFLLGGLAFYLCGLANEVIPWEMLLVWQSVIASVIITALEFVTGCIINLWLGWNVWDYSNMPLNLLGQICVPFMLLWLALGTVAIVTDDYLRYWLFGEEKPHYQLF